ncbi:MAG TPA: DUF4910 domain-containing protein [Streptosporangiaceae bacterium]|nr:DUF4910 domain-containing protein [Streptosporangiaceae bacterium]
MRLADLVTAVHAEFDQEQALADVIAVCQHDRYQASAGIAAAAAYVAERARAAGLAEVTVLSFPADGARRWWSYRAPLPWTPVRARLVVAGDAVVRYPEQAYTLAAYSAPTLPGERAVPVLRWSAVRRGADPCGALVVADEPVALGAVTGPLTAAGAVAVALDPLGGRPDRRPDQVGRLELPAGCELSAFSVTQAQIARLLAAADTGAPTSVEVCVDPAGFGVPVVTGWLPGTSDEEFLLTAHLCHPKPGANDNASGVAALLGIARVLAAHQGNWAGRGATAAGRPGVRFLWGPEFVGIAAYLHDEVLGGRAARPTLAVNVDMAGQNVQRCGGPLVIERGPDDLPSFLPALAERCAGLLPVAARSYSGAVPCDPWTWRATPFAGGSDHALLADSPTRCQAVALGHWPDRANHSSADTADLVDPAELRRTAAVACAVAAAVRRRADPELAADVGEATLSWAADHVLATLPGRRPARRPFGPSHDGPELDPHADVNAALWLRHRGEVAVGAVEALSAAGLDSAWLDAAIASVRSIAAVAAARIADGQQEPPGCEPEHASTRRRQACASHRDRGSADRGSAGRPLVRCWDGPANLRALAEAATPQDRHWLDDKLSQDRGGNYTRAVALLHGVDGERSERDVAWWAALSSELPMPIAFAEGFLGMLGRAGWVRVPADGGH